MCLWSLGCCNTFSFSLLLPLFLPSWHSSVWPCLPWTSPDDPASTYALPFIDMKNFLPPSLVTHMPCFSFLFNYLLSFSPLPFLHSFIPFFLLFYLPFFLFLPLMLKTRSGLTDSEPNCWLTLLMYEWIICSCWVCLPPNLILEAAFSASSSLYLV